MEEVVTQKPLPLGDWDELIGHPAERLRLASGGRFPSLLFSGPKGLGKRLVAAWLAAHLNCQNPPAQPPWTCSCRNCTLVLRNQHPDVVWSERAPGKLSLGVGEARELIQQLYLRPYQASCRVCIISEADRLTDEAQSALLKTLEEPPESNVLVLVTSQEARLLPTVQSRCRIYRFRPVEDSLLMTWLQSRGCPEEAAARYTGLSQGCPGQALRYWEQPALWEAHEQLLESLQELHGSSLGRCLELAGKSEALKIPGLEGREQLEWVLATTQAYFRDALLVGNGATHVVHQYRRAQLEKLAQQPQRLLRCLSCLQESRQYFLANVNTRLLLQDLFLKLRS